MSLNMEREGAREGEERERDFAALYCCFCCCFSIAPSSPWLVPRLYVLCQLFTDLNLKSHKSDVFEQKKLLSDATTTHASVSLQYGLEMMRRV